MAYLETGVELRDKLKKPILGDLKPNYQELTKQETLWERGKFQVAYQNKTLIFGKLSVPFSRSKIKDKIMRTFFATTNLTVGKELLLHALYSEKIDQHKSVRYYKCLNHNTIKSISRCREKLSVLSAKYYPEIFWFPYDSLTNSYQLYRMIDGSPLCSQHSEAPQKYSLH